jgi:hypothetical protein
MSRNEIKEIANATGDVETAAGIQSLAAALYWECVHEARQMPPEDKFLAGEELFEYACAITLAGIRNQSPEADEERCRQILEGRLAFGERLVQSQ